MTPVIVVTGASQGIGAAIATVLLAHGYSVVGVGRDAAKLNAIAHAHAHDRFTPVVGDVRNTETLDEAVAVAEGVGHLVGWVNNAGVTFTERLHEASDEAITQVLDINLLAVIRGSQRALATFIRTSTPGSIVNISSIHGQAAFAGWSVYDAAKGGMDALTRSICAEYGHLGIRCNAVAPGAVATEILDRLVDQADDSIAFLDEVRALSPMRIVVTAEQVGESVAWLMSSAAGAINGQILAVDGGALSRCASSAPDPLLRFPQG